MGECPDGYLVRGSCIRGDRLPEGPTKRFQRRGDYCRRQSPEERLLVIHPSDAKGNLIEKDIGHIALKAGDRKNVKVN